MQPYPTNTKVDHSMTIQDEGEPLDILELDENLSDVEKPPILAKGRYEAECVEVSIQTSSGKGNRYYSIAVRVPPEQIPANQQDAFEDGAVLYWNRQLVPTGKDQRAKYNLRKLLEAFDMPTQITTFDPNELMGQRVGIVVDHERWQGEDRAQIKSLFTIDSGSAPNKPAPKAEPEPEQRAAPKGRNRR